MNDKEAKAISKIAFEVVLRWIDLGHDVLTIKKGVKYMIEELSKENHETYRGMKQNPNDSTIKKLDLPNRTIRILDVYGLTTLNDLLNADILQIRGLRGLGHVGMQGIKELIRDYYDHLYEPNNTNTIDPYKTLNK
mgnify:CR=1 FL=1